MVKDVETRGNPYKEKVQDGHIDESPFLDPFDGKQSIVPFDTPHPTLRSLPEETKGSGQS